MSGVSDIRPMSEMTTTSDEADFQVLARDVEDTDAGKEKQHQHYKSFRNTQALIVFENRLRKM